MHINGLGHAQAAQGISNVQRAAAGSRAHAADQSPAALPADELDLSPEAQAISQIQEASSSESAGGIRWEKVNALRQAIAEGNYETTDRLSGAIDNFLDAFA